MFSITNINIELYVQYTIMFSCHHPANILEPIIGLNRTLADLQLN